MDLPPGYARTDVTDEDRADLEAVHQWGFAYPEPPADEPLPPVGWVWERTTAVRESGTGQIAATATSLPFTVEVPGGARVAAGGLSDVAVHPGHRRRGLARAVLVEHLRETAARGELFSMLFAAEAAIYGRFGYGCASTHVEITVPRGAALRELPAGGARGGPDGGGEDGRGKDGDAPVRVGFAPADAARHAALVSAVHAAAGAGRPGWALREGPALAARPFADPPSERAGREQLKIAIATTAGGARDGGSDGTDGSDGSGSGSGDGRAVGYALFARRETWRDGQPTGAVVVREIAATTPAAARALWSALLDLDLMATTEVALLAPDDALLHLLVDPRAAAPRVRDNTWVRLVDVPGALAARRYTADIDVVLDVTDALLPAGAGRWHLTAPAGGRGAVRRLEDGAARPGADAGRGADLALDVRELAAAYLGGTPLTALAGAGLVRELTPGALLRTSAAFAAARAPFCSWIF